MSTYDESQHPRGQARNAGQFREKTNDAPATALADADNDGYRTWRILADRLGDFSTAVEKENRRLERAGVAERFSFTHERSVWRDEDGRPWVVEDVTLNRPRISVGSWEFLAQHEKTAGGAIITHHAGGRDDSTKVTADPSMRCDHCGQFRSRQKVFTVRDRETGEIKQIGSSCLALFLGTKPEGLWAMAREVGEDLRFDEEEAWSGPATTNAYDGDQLLLATIRQVAADGDFVPRSRAGFGHVATVDKVKGSMSVLTAEPATTAEANELRAIADWVDELEPGDEDGYLQNLSAAFTRDSDGNLVVHSKHAGLVASAVSAHRRHIAQQLKTAAREKLAAAKLAEFAYEPGESLKGKGLEATVISMHEGQDYGYGAPMHITLIDDEGHVFYWKATGLLSSQVELSDGAGYTFLPTAGERLRITGGSVKMHRISDFNGDHETVIWRVKTEPTAEWIDAREREHAQELADRAAAKAEG